MGILDFFRAKKQPEKRRIAPTFRPGLRRSFDAGKSSSLFANWSTNTLTPDQMATHQLPTLKNRSRNLYCNDDLARNFIKILKTNIVGQGFKLQGRIVSASGKADDAASSAVESAWADWGKRKLTVCGRMTMRDLQVMFIQTVALDGEFLARKHFGAGPHGYQLEVLDTRRLDPCFNDELQNGNVIKSSIELDRSGRRVAYYLATTAQMPGTYFSRGKHYQRIDADEIIHEFLPEFAEQQRGFPWMSAAMIRMQNLAGYEEAAITAARIGASKMGFYTSPDGDPVAIASEEKSDGDFLHDVAPGQFEVLPDGYQFQAFDPTYPTAEFAAFTKTCTRFIASGLGVGYNQLANDLEGVNYSSARVGILEDREVFSALQQWMIEAFLEPLFADWLRYALLAGKIVIKGRVIDATRYDKFNNVQFMPRRWANVDPLKEAKANAELVAHGAKSISQWIREQGSEPDDVWEEIRRERETLKDLGITIGKEQSPVANEEPEDESEEEDAA